MGSQGTGTEIPAPDGRPTGIWAALGERHAAGEEQRCWNHKILNVLNALAKKAQPEVAERADHVCGQRLGVR